VPEEALAFRNYYGTIRLRMNTSGRKVLISGAAGFIGSRLTRRLLDEGWSVRCMVRHTAAGIPDILSYREMMERFGRIEGKNLLILPVPVLTPKLSSYWVGLITPVPPSVSMPLIEGLKNEVVCREDSIRALIPIRLTPYDEAVRAALAAESDGKI